MKISTKGRYALRAMVELARRYENGYVPLKELSGKLGISQKYLEGIMSSLSKAGFVDAARGKGGDTVSTAIRRSTTRWTS